MPNHLFLIVDGEVCSVPDQPRQLLIAVKPVKKPSRIIRMAFGKGFYHFKVKCLPVYRPRKSKYNGNVYAKKQEKSCFLNRYLYPVFSGKKVLLRF